MIEPISVGTIGTGFRMIWSGIRWLWHSRQAPWTAINLSARLNPHIDTWHHVRFFAVNEKPFAIEILSVRTIRPKDLLLRLSNDQIGGPDMRAGTDARLLKDIRWAIPEESVNRGRFDRSLFVNLDKLHGQVQIDFELKCRFLNNRRSEMPVWVRTNSIERP